MDGMDNISPAEALRIVTRRMRPKAPQSFPLDEAPDGYLAEEVEVSLSAVHGKATADRVPRATENGYALVEQVRQGDICRVRGTRTAGGAVLDAHGGKPPPPQREGSCAPAQPDLRALWRVETGAPLPSGTWAVLPVEQAPLLAPARIRVDELPAPGRAMEPVCAAETAGGGAESMLRFACGTSLDGGLRALLETCGVSHVQVHPAFAVGFATIGGELTDPAAWNSASSRHGSFDAAAQVPDLLALALEERIRRLRLAPMALGILEDTPQSMEAGALRARQRKVEVLLLAGGLGDGLTDRTVESLRKMEAEIVLHARVFGPGSAFLHARVHGYDVLAVSGNPLVATAQLDLFVVPALRARLGAPQRSWDWSRTRWPTRLRSTGAKPLRVVSGWQVLPAAPAEREAGPPEVEAWQPPTLCVPRLPGQEGWAILGPAAAEAPADRPAEKQSAYFQPMAFV